MIGDDPEDENNHQEITHPEGRIILGNDCTLYLQRDDGSMAIYKGPNDLVELGMRFKLDQDYNLCRIEDDGTVVRAGDEFDNSVVGEIDKTVFFDEDGLLTFKKPVPREEQIRKNKRKNVMKMLKSMDKNEIERMTKEMGIKNDDNPKDVLKKLSKRLCKTHDI